MESKVEERNEVKQEEKRKKSIGLKRRKKK